MELSAGFVSCGHGASQVTRTVLRVIFFVDISLPSYAAHTSHIIIIIIIMIYLPKV